MTSPDAKDIFSIPQVAFQDHLFPLLRLNDLLRLRRVCKAFKTLAEQHIRGYHVNIPREIEICQQPSDRSLAAFLAMGIPAATVYINNTSVHFFDDPNIPQFLEQYASKITHLRVHHFSAFANSTEMPFFNALTKMQHLEFEEIDATNWRCDFEVLTLEDGKEVDRRPCPIAKTFKNLKTLKFGHIKTLRKHDHGYWVDVILCCCEHLEHIGHPKYDHPIPPNSNNPFGIPLPPELMPLMVPGLSSNDTFKCVSRVIEWRHEKHGDKPNLQYYDIGLLNDTREDGGSLMNFVFFAKTCYDHGVKLLNVNADFYQAVGPSQDEFYQSVVVPLVSVRNLNRALFLKELPSLEKVVIMQTSKSTYYPLWDERRGKPQWPRLRTLDITVDSDELEELEGLSVGMQDVTELYEFLFTKVVRKELTDLAVRFDEKAVARHGGELPCPRAIDIRSSCPNIKRLTLENWVGTNKALSLLWSGLTCLEELVLKDCKGLGNVAFVGERKGEPTFLKLKRLKSLTLIGFEKMPKVTDTVFTLVIRHLPLTKLFLVSRNPSKNISTTGIKSLLSGKFAGTIEKFPFKDWSLQGTSVVEFKKLERQFRSYYMT